MEIRKGKVTDYDLRSYFKDNLLNYLFILEIDDSLEYSKHLSQAEYNLFISKILGGFGVSEVRDVVEKFIEYEFDGEQIVKIKLQNNIEI